MATTTTDSNGDYTFSGIPDGTYTVDETDDNNVLEGAWKTSGTPNTDGQSQADPLTVTLAGGQTAPADFGYYKTTATLGNYVWNDTDRDGIQDGREAGLANVPVTLTITYPNGNVVTVVTTTDANGAYSFANILADESFDGVGAGEPTFVWVRLRKEDAERALRRPGVTVSRMEFPTWVEIPLESPLFPSRHS